MDVREYLRDELIEEADLGIVSAGELERRLALFDGRAATTVPRIRNKSGDGGSSPLVAEDDPSLSIEVIQATGKEALVDSYLARPRGVGAAPGILVIHENRGLTPYVKDVARRLAKLGYVALAPDLLTPKGGADSFADPAEAIAALGTLDRDQMLDELIASLSQLAGLGDVDGSRLGVIGFCFGGGMAWRLMTKDSRLVAGVPFYGANPALEDVPGINAAVLAIYGALDERINAGIDAITAAMAAAGKSFDKEVYQGAGHAFHNNTNPPERYNAEAASAAWERATAFFEQHLNG